MGNLATLLTNLTSVFTTLHFNTKIGVVGLLLVIFHTIGAIVLMAMKLVEEETGRLILEYSLSATVFIIMALIINTGVRKYKQNKGSCDVKTNTDQTE